MARFINYLLVPIQTAKFTAAGGQYGIITNVYAYVALLIIILTYGMETTFFRFMNKAGERPEKVYSTTLATVGTTSLLFAVVVLLFGSTIASWLGYADHPAYIMVMYTTVAIDAFTAIPFAYLRCMHRPWKFAALKMLNIVLNIVLNLLYLVILPYFKINPLGIYDANFTLDVVWVFYINMFCSVATLLFLWKELKGFRFGFDWQLCKRMLRYTWPLLVMGVAGQLNQTASQIIFPYMFDGSTADARTQLGIYGACIKIAMIMVMITQAFRYAYEPFVFGKSKDKDNRETYAVAMKYFIIFTLLAFLCVIAYIDILRFVIPNPSYWEGLRVVPIVMAAEIMMGVYFNLSFWYKLIDKTIYGAWFSAAGCLVLVIVNVLFVPKYSYMACAWGGVAGYGTAMVLSYLVGQKKYPINYPLKSIAVYVAITALFFFLMTLSNEHLPQFAALAANTVLVILFIAHIVYHDLPLKRMLRRNRHS